MAAAHLTAPDSVAWGAPAVMLYAYFGYPRLPMVFGEVRRPRPILIKSEARPTVTVVVAAVKRRRRASGASTGRSTGERRRLSASTG